MQTQKAIAPTAPVAAPFFFNFGPRGFKFFL